MSSTIRDVVKLSGLSLGTVSKYINGQTIKEKNKRNTLFTRNVFSDF